MPTGLREEVRRWANYFDVFPDEKKCRGCNKEDGTEKHIVYLPVLEGGQKTCPPLTCAQRVRRNSSLPLPIFLASFGPLFSEQFFWDQAI